MPAGAFNRQHAFSAGRAREHGPDLPQSRPANGDAIDCDKVVARLNSIVAFRHGRFALVVGNAEDGELSIILRPQDQANNIEIRNVEQSPNVEIDRRVRIVDPYAVIE